MLVREAPVDQPGVVDGDAPRLRGKVDGPALHIHLLLWGRRTSKSGEITVNLAVKFAVKFAVKCAMKFRWSLQ